jgi:hypothetical protein
MKRNSPVRDGPRCHKDTVDFELSIQGIGSDPGIKYGVPGIPRNGFMAARTCGSRGVVPLWSRYTGLFIIWGLFCIIALLVNILRSTTKYIIIFC